MHTARRLLIVAVWLAFVGVLLEAGAWAALTLLDNDVGDRSERHLYNPVRGHALNPRYRRDFDTGGERIHSDQGFRRDGEVVPDKPDDVVRVFVLGGSALYGIGVQDDAVYPKQRTLRNDELITAYLERDLNAALATAGVDARVEVINAGVTAYHTFQHVAYVMETLYEYDPDVLLFLDGHNDFYVLGPLNPMREYGYSSHNMVRALNARQPFFALNVAARVPARYSHFFKLVEKSAFRLFERHEGKPHARTPAASAAPGTVASSLALAANDGFLRSYRLIETLAAHYGFAFHVFLQPEIVHENPARLGPADRRIRELTIAGYGDGAAERMAAIRSELPALFERSGLPFSDIGSIAGAADDAPLYLDYCHLTAAGSERVASAMLPLARQLVQARLAARRATD